jgi:hypothetical protein
MKLYHIAAAAALLLGISTAQAADLKPIHAKRIDLGQVSGIAYYTVEADGFHVVATFAHDETDRDPIRVQTVLAAGQSVTFSTPGSVGAKPVSVRFAHHGKNLVVQDSTTTD